MVVRRGHKLVRFRFLRALRMVRRDCPSQSRQVIDFTVTEARQTLDCGEAYMALEILISNLYEVAFPLSAVLHAELRWLVARLLLDSSYQAHLDELRRGTRASHQ